MALEGGSLKTREKQSPFVATPSSSTRSALIFLMARTMEIARTWTGGGTAGYAIEVPLKIEFLCSNDFACCTICGKEGVERPRLTSISPCDECCKWKYDPAESIDEETMTLTRVHVPSNNSCLFVAAVFLCDERCSLITPDNDWPTTFYDAANDLRQRCAEYVKSSSDENLLPLLGMKSAQEYENSITDRNYPGGEIELNMIADIYKVQFVIILQNGNILLFGSDKCEAVYMVYDEKNQAGKFYDPLCSIGFGCRFPPLSTTDTLVRRRRHMYALKIAKSDVIAKQLGLRQRSHHFLMHDQLKYVRRIMQREKEREERHELRLRGEQRRKEREIQKTKYRPRKIDATVHVPDAELDIQIDLIRREAQEKVEREQEKAKAYHAEICMKQQIQKAKQLEEQREAFTMRKLKQVEAEKLASDEKQRLAESKYVKDQIAIANAKEERCRKKQERKLSKKKLSVWELQEQEKQRAEEEQLANERFAAELASKLKLR